MKIKTVFSLALGSILFLSVSLQAIEFKPFSFKSDQEATEYYQSHYRDGINYYKQRRWRQSITEFEKLIYFFPEAREISPAYYYLGVAYFQIGEYDFANKAFSDYIKAPGHPEFFDNAVQYKFYIAESFSSGTRRRPLKFRYFPKWLPAKTMALSVYDEVIVALPSHELAANSLYSKGNLLASMRSYSESNEAFQMFIRRFPKHELVPQAYLKIGENYYEQSQYEVQNPDILALAEINSRRFKEEFPRDESYKILQEHLCKMKEVYAQGLADIGKFYEKLGRPAAAIIYYQAAIKDFPSTEVAKFCCTRLKKLGASISTDNVNDTPTIPQEAT